MIQSVLKAIDILSAFGEYAQTYPRRAERSPRYAKGNRSQPPCHTHLTGLYREDAWKVSMPWGQQSSPLRRLFESMLSFVIGQRPS